MEVYKMSNWKRSLGVGIVTCLLFPTVTVGDTSNNILDSNWTCYTGNFCMGQKSSPATNCSSCSLSNPPCKVCCEFKGDTIQMIQKCPPPIRPRGLW